MAQNRLFLVVAILVVVLVIVLAWRFLARPKFEPVVQFTPEQAKQAEQERQRLQQGGSPLPLPPKGGRR